MTEDLLIGQTGELEQFHWFVRAHLENSGGQLSTEGATTEAEAADAAREPSGVRRRRPPARSRTAATSSRPSPAVPRLAP